MEDSRDLEFDAITEKDIFEEARDRLKICQDSESKNRSLAKEDLRFREGDQWPHTNNYSVSQDDIELTINLTDAMVKRVTNNMKEQRPRGKAHPVGDGANIETAELINGIGRHIEYRSEASVAYDTAGDMAVTCGWGYIRLISEYVAPDSFEQDIRILPIRNIFTVYMDPAAIMPTGHDADWVIISTKMKRTEYKRRYPRAPNKDWQDAGSEERNRDWEDKEEIRLAEYFRIREKKDELYELRRKDGSTFTMFRSQMPKDQLLEAGVQIIDERDSYRKQVEWFRLNGTKVVERQEIPGTWIPVIRCEGNAVDIDGEIHRRGMVRSMQDPQRMVDYALTASIKRLGLTPQAPWIAAEGQLDGHPEWMSSNTTSYPVLTYKPITGPDGMTVLPPPIRQPPAQIEAGFLEFTNSMRSNLLAVAGMPNDPGQDMQGQVVSGRAIDRRQKLSDQSHFQYYDNQTLMIAQAWRIMLEWIPVYYSEARMTRIIGEDGVPSTVQLKEPVQDMENPSVITLKNDPTVGRYDVVMDTGPGYETKRQEGAETLLDLVNNSALGQEIAKVGPDLVLRSIDHPYMQELADRFSAMVPDQLKKVVDGLPSRAKQIIQALSGQIQALQQANQQLMLEQKYGIQKVHMQSVTKAHDTEVRAETARHDTRTKADTARFDTIVKADTALKTAEIAAGASLLNTHVEAKYHKEEAERMIEAGHKAESNGQSRS